MKKKLTALTLSLVLALSLVACGGKEEKADTAETEATTEVAEEPVAAAETTEEAAPVEEEPEPEVAEEAPEEVEEEPLPTIANDIWHYLSKNGKPGDYMVSQNNELIAYPVEDKTYDIVNVKSIDGKLYRVHTMSVYNTHPTNAIATETPSEAYTFVEQTDKKNTFKLEIRLPEGTIEHLKNDIEPDWSAMGEYKPFIRFGSYDDMVWDVDINDFVNDRVQILINVDHEVPPPYGSEYFRVISGKIYDYNKDAAAAAINGALTFFTNNDQDQILLDRDIHDIIQPYTLVTD